MKLLLLLLNKLRWFFFFSLISCFHL